ncbi:MAG: hypothetical protein Kow00121_29770 [Elainellaceae cyanobacterium]
MVKSQETLDLTYNKLFLIKPRETEALPQFLCLLRLNRDRSMTNQQLPPSLWQLKPWWCQPWSIVLTGIIVSGGAWLLSHRLWVTVPIVLGVAAWWLLFLYLVPRQYAEMVDAASNASSSE